MFILKNAHTDEKKTFPTIYQLGKYLLEIGVAKTQVSHSWVKQCIKNGRAIFKCYFVYEIPDAK